MKVTYTNGKATFNVTFHEADDDEMTGNCSWQIKLEDIAKLYKETEFQLDNFSDPTNFEEWDAENSDADETHHESSADALIILLAAAGTLDDPTTFELDYYGHPYWFFHDTVHAEYDSGDGSDIYIDSDSEERALPMGAERAARAGADIADILRELVKAEKEFEPRFGYAFDPVGAFLESVELVLK